MDAYLFNLIISLSKMVVLFFLLLVLVPKLTVLKVLGLEPGDQFFAGVVIMGSFLIFLAHALVLLKVYHVLSLALGLLVATAAFWGIWFKGKNYELVTKPDYTLRRYLEDAPAETAIRYNDELENSLAKETITLNRIWMALLVFVLGVTGGLRLAPVFQQAALFTVESYQNLDYVKQLQAQHLFPDQALAPKGMHALIDIFFQFTRVDPSLIVHLFGAFTAILTAGMLYFLVTKMTNNRAVAVMATALFGIFSRLLPTNIQQQVEANTILLSAVFVFLGLNFLLDYFSTQRKKYLLVALAGLAGAMLISLFSAAMILWALLPLSLTFNFYLKLTNRLTGFRWLNLLLPGLVVLLWAGIFWATTNNFHLAETIRILVHDDVFNRFNRSQLLSADSHYLILGAVAGIFLLWLSHLIRQKKQSLYFRFFGYFLISLMFLLKVENLGLPDLFGKGQIGLFFSLLLCLSLGIIIHVVFFEILGKGFLNIQSSSIRQAVFGLIVFLLLSELLIFLKTPAVAKFDSGTEPDGFIKSVYEIQQDYPALQWTAVSHFGTAIQIKNSGQFLDYDFFLNNFEPKNLNQIGTEKMAMKNLFIFVEKARAATGIDSALLPDIEQLNIKLQNWILEYQRSFKNIDIFYEDDQVRVYRIAQPGATKSTTAQL